MVDFQKIQTQLNASAATSHETETVPPFSCYFNADDDAPWANYAMPDEPVFGDVERALTQLVECFRKRQRMPRFEYVAAFAPVLSAALEEYGFECEDRNVLMSCTPQSLQSAPPVDKLTINEVTDETPLTVLQNFVTVQGRAFAGDDHPQATPDDAERFRERFHTVRTFLANLDGVPVGAGSLTAAYDGIAEVAGIATLTAYRRRGIAAAMTEHISKQAFADGVETLFLTAADEAAGRVYGRVGYQQQGHTLTYVLP